VYTFSRKGGSASIVVEEDGKERGFIAYICEAASVKEVESVYEFIRSAENRDQS
jgi:hypothetical protein